MRPQGLPSTTGPKEGLWHHSHQHQWREDVTLHYIIQYTMYRKASAAAHLLQDQSEQLGVCGSGSIRAHGRYAMIRPGQNKQLRQAMHRYRYGGCNILDLAGDLTAQHIETYTAFSRICGILGEKAYKIQRRHDAAANLRGACTSVLVIVLTLCSLCPRPEAGPLLASRRRRVRAGVDRLACRRCCFALGPLQTVA